MILPYVIDNQTHILADMLQRLLTEHKGRSLDVATAYFTVGGFGFVQEGLTALGNFRLLLGAEPTTGEQLGLRPDAAVVRGLIRRDLEQLPFDEKTLRLVEDLIGYLQGESVQVRLHDKGFLHAKCWLFYSHRPGQQMLFDRFRPILAIVGSSNFTIPGLTSNRELNLAHKVLLDPAEVEDRDAAYSVSWLSDVKPSERITPANRQLLKSEVGAEATIAVNILSQEELGREEFDPYSWSDADVILVDESHNFRNQTAQRYGALEQILGGNGGRGRDGMRKKVILITATPISNDLFDLYNQFSLITQGNRSYFAASGIGDLYRYFLHARRQSRAGDRAFALFNLLEEIVIRRSRPFIRQAYPSATIRRKEADGSWSEMKVHFPNGNSKRFDTTSKRPMSASMTKW